MDEARFNRLVAFTKQNFIGPHQREVFEPPGATWDYLYNRVLPASNKKDFVRYLRGRAKVSRMAWDWVRSRSRRKLPQRPKTRGPDKDAFSVRDRLIALAISHVVKRFDLDAMRDQSRATNCCAEGGSACDVVGRAFFGGREYSYKNVERIWNNRDPLITPTKKN